MATRRDGPRSSRLRTPLVVALGLLFFFFISASGLAELYTDYLWFDALDRSSVWTTVLGTQLALAGIFFIIFFLVLWLNLLLADRLAPEVRPQSPEEDLIERYHQVVGDHTAKIRLGVAGLFALVAGGNTAGQWRTWILFRNGDDFGQVDPLFQRDAGFYVFRLPFWTFLIDWFFSALVFALIVSLIAHYLNGGIRASVANNRVSSGVKLHISGLLAVLAFLRAGAYWLDRYELVTSTRGLYDGALTTDVEVQLPALNLLALISLVGAGLFIVNIRRQGWALPMVAVGIWLVSHIVVGSVFPALFQRLRVEPQQSDREEVYIGNNIEATRFAYGLGEDRLTLEVFPYQEGLTTEVLEANQDIIDDVALLDPALAADAFTRSQAEIQLYQFAETLDVDRYDIGGDLEPVALAVRSLRQRNENDWEVNHIVQTHGYGVALAAADRSAGGLPDYQISGIGPTTNVAEGLDGELTRPHVYYDVGFGGYAIVGASRAEETTFSDELSEAFRYDGDGGVEMSGLIRRTAFSLRFSQLNPLISPFVQDGSRVIYNRDVELRVRELAPFLEFDSDPYPIVADGELLFVIDAYTTTNRYPYAQQVEVRSVPSSADLSGGYNYVRNSVKAVVDAYNGDVAFYVMDEEDPIIEAYSQAFPELFSPASEVPDAVRDHFRYPVDLFKVQTETWDTYQVDDSIRFLEGARSWRVSSQPGDSADSDEPSTLAAALMNPQYRVTRLPGETDPEFILQRSFVPGSSDSGRPEVTAIMVGRSDGENAGKLVQYRLPSGELNAPGLADSEIRKNDGITDFISLRNREASVLFGEMQLVMLGNTVVYVRPLYIKADTDIAVPELTRVIAVSGNRIAMANTLDNALAAITVDGDGLPTSPADDDVVDSGEDPVVSQPGGDFSGLSVTELVQQVERLLDDANRVQDTEPDVAADLRADALAALEQLQDLLGVPAADVVPEPAGA